YIINCNKMDYDLVDELIGFPNFSSLNEQVRQQTGKVSLPAVKKMLADNEQFQAILDQNHGMQQAYNKYLAANTKANDLTRQQQSKQQFLGCVAKHTPPEVFQKCVEQYDDPDAKYEHRSDLALILGVLKRYRSAEESDDPYTMHLWSQIDPIPNVAYKPCLLATTPMRKSQVQDIQTRATFNESLFIKNDFKPKKAKSSLTFLQVFQLVNDVKCWAQQQHLPEGIREYSQYYKQVSKEGNWSRCKRQNQKKDTASCREYRR
ncbi:hypothetical protein PROFUN_16663, partial [Planoprotostelium fungivorum]